MSGAQVRAHVALHPGGTPRPMRVGQRSTLWRSTWRDVVIGVLVAVATVVSLCLVVPAFALEARLYADYKRPP
jgi:hypothetical protein